MVALDREIMNLERIKNEYNSRCQHQKVQLTAPALNVTHNIDNKLNFNDLQNNLFDMARQFPHKRMVLTYKTTDEEVIIEMHPVTGAA